MAGQGLRSRREGISVWYRGLGAGFPVQKIGKDLRGYVVTKECVMSEWTALK